MAAPKPSVSDALLEGDDHTDKVLSTLSLEDLTVTEAEAKVLNDEEQAMDTDGELKDLLDDPETAVTEQESPYQSLLRIRLRLVRPNLTTMRPANWMRQQVVFLLTLLPSIVMWRSQPRKSIPRMVV